MSYARALLFCAHPGHELRVYGWLRAARPAVCFLTDGSGADGTPRVARSTELIAAAGARPGAMYGASSDRTVYAALLAGDLDVFRGLAHQLARTVSDGPYDAVVGDAAEGYNPSHDVARMLIDAAVSIARAGGAEVENFAFPLVGHPQEAPAGTSAGPAPTLLDDALLAEKIERARAYAGEGGGILVSEVDEAIERYGIDAFRDERLFVAGDVAALEARFDHEPPFYETYGEQQVAAGKYSYVIRWKQHVRPVAHALREEIAASKTPDRDARTG